MGSSCLIFDMFNLLLYTTPHRSEASPPLHRGEIHSAQVPRVAEGHSDSVAAPELGGEERSQP